MDKETMPRTAHDCLPGDSFPDPIRVPFTKTVRLGTTDEASRRSSVYAKIEWNGSRLSITGVVGPMPSGNALGSCGQIEMSRPAIKNCAPGWNLGLVKQFWETWSRWHLNDMRAECEHQRKRGETWQSHPSAVCPDCGYKLGHAWLKETVPTEVLTFLRNLPDTDKTPAWS